MGHTYRSQHVGLARDFWTTDLGTTLCWAVVYEEKETLQRGVQAVVRHSATYPAKEQLSRLLTDREAEEVAQAEAEQAHVVKTQMAPEKRADEKSSEQKLSQVDDQPEGVGMDTTRT